MRVFVYTKADSKKIATITDVVLVTQEKDKVFFSTRDGVNFTFDCKKVKTTCYQN